MAECSYYRCRNEAVGILPRRENTWPLCAEHREDKWHPPDVQRKLSMFFRTWAELAAKEVPGA